MDMGYSLFGELARVRMPDWERLFLRIALLKSGKRIIGPLVRVNIEWTSEVLCTEAMPDHHRGRLLK
jgi:hypothetical protein